MDYAITTRRLSVLVFCLLMLLSFWGKGQDVHLSQYEVAPLQINPANTGDFEEDFRACANYRRQWASLGTPYQNYALTADKPFQFGKSKVGLGLMFLHDNVALQQFKTTQFMASFSYEYLVADYLFRFGAQAGVWTRGYENNGITYPGQYDPITGRYDPNAPINDEILATNATALDVNIGASAVRVINGMRATAGVAIQHVNVPKVSYGSTDSRLPLLWSFNADIVTQPLSWMSLRPSLLVKQQQRSDQAIVGALARTTNNWTVQNLNSLAFGTYLRSAMFENVDAVILSAGVHYADFEVFFSYDVNISDLSKATGYNGATEIGVVYKFKKKKNIFVKPCLFM